MMRYTAVRRVVWRVCFAVLCCSLVGGSGAVWCAIGWGEVEWALGGGGGMAGCRMA